MTETKRLRDEIRRHAPRCAVHGGRSWRGGYCDRWPQPGTGPCVQESDDHAEWAKRRAGERAQDCPKVER